MYWPHSLLVIAGVITDSGGDIIDVGFPQPRGVVVAGGGQGCACRGLKTTELTLLAQDRPACTSTVNSRVEVRDTLQSGAETPAPGSPGTLQPSRLSLGGQKPRAGGASCGGPRRRIGSHSASDADMTPQPRKR